MGLKTKPITRETFIEHLRYPELLRWYCDRASDPNHPGGWLESWPSDVIEDVRRAAELLDEAWEEARHSWD